MANKLTEGSNLRWESMRMILPEWREQWLRHQQEQKKVKKPVLDEQQWEEFEWLLNEAMRENAELVFTYWEDGYFYEVAEWCHFVKTSQQQFHVKDSDDDPHYIPFDQLTDIRRAGD